MIEAMLSVPQADVLRIVAAMWAGALLFWLGVRWWRRHHIVYPVLGAYLLSMMYASSISLGTEPVGWLPLIRLLLLGGTTHFLIYTSIPSVRVDRTNSTDTRDSRG